MTQAIEDEIWAAIRESNAAWMDDRPLDVAPLYAENAVMLAPDLTARVDGRSAIVQSYVDYTTQVRTHAFEEGAHSVLVQGEVALAVYAFKVRYELEGNTYDDEGQETLVFSRRDDGWKVIWRTQVTLRSKRVE